MFTWYFVSYSELEYNANIDTQQEGLQVSAFITDGF